MLINLSNHPSDRWSAEQICTAQNEYGGVVDVPFPNVKPSADHEEIIELSDRTIERVVSLGFDAITVHVMGEMTLTYAIVTKLKGMGVKCVASTTERLVHEFDNGRKEVVFQFVRFREY